MNLYSNKQRWKIFLLFSAMLIVGVTLWYSNHIADRIRDEEHQKVELWSEAVERRAELVNFTELLFKNLRDEERKKANVLAEAYQILSAPADQNDLTFVTNVLFGDSTGNKTIPILIYDDQGELVLNANLPVGKENDSLYIDSLYKVMRSKYNPIIFPEVGHKLYYNDSYIVLQLQVTMDDLINSFISETVINAASVPVIVTDSTQLKILKIGNIDSTLLTSPQLAISKIERMRKHNAPIMIDLPGQGKEYIFYEDSEVLQQLQLFPVVQLILIGAFLLVSYLIFSTFRKAEQNQVWVGMAKETAHQLGTPLSSLMAWTELLESSGVDKSILVELNKDIDRLNTITDRFSKIGSKTDLQETNVLETVRSSFDYLQKRVSSRVEFFIQCEDPDITAMINKPLFGWVLENLVKNAVDAMDGQGRLSTVIMHDGGIVAIELTDSGKGILKNKWSTVFQPGFTTKKRGWGLGLSLVKRIIENYHNGKIFVKWSEINKGTTFRIELRH